MLGKQEKGGPVSSLSMVPFFVASREAISSKEGTSSPSLIACPALLFLRGWRDGGHARIAHQAIKPLCHIRVLTEKDRLPLFPGVYDLVQCLDQIIGLADSRREQVSSIFPLPPVPGPEQERYEGTEADGQAHNATRDEQCRRQAPQDLPQIDIGAIVVPQLMCEKRPEIRAFE